MKSRGQGPKSGVKMHPLYQDVCSVLSQAERRKGTLKRLCLGSGIRNKRATLALASETSR